MKALSSSVYNLNKKLSKYIKERVRLKKKFMLGICLLIALMLVTACSDEKSTKANEVKDDYPNQDIDLLVGFAAGGGSDVVTRTVAKLLNEEGIIEENFVVENMPGAGGGLALMELKKRSDDPHVLLSMPDVGDPVWDGTIDADVSDFSLIAQLATDSIFIVVNSNSSYESFDDLVNDLKENPGSIDIGLGADVNSEEGHLWYEIAEAHGIDFLDLNFIPHDGGAEITSALLGGHIDATAVNPSSIAGHIEAEELRPLVVLSPERVEYFPDVPTLIEEGVDHVYVRARGIWGGGDLSEEVIKFWEDKLEELVNSESWQTDYIEKNLLVNDFKRSEEYEEYIIETAEKLEEFKEKFDE